MWENKTNIIHWKLQKIVEVNEKVPKYVYVVFWHLSFMDQKT